MRMILDETPADKELAKALARIDVLMLAKAKLRYERPLWARLFLK